MIRNARLVLIGSLMLLIVPNGIETVEIRQYLVEMYRTVRELFVDKSYYYPSAILDGVDPRLLEIAEEIITELRKQGFDAIIHNGMRSKAQAAANAASGVGILKSKHIVGEAVDIIDKRYAWDTKYLAEIKKFRLAYGALTKNYPEVTWGGTWTKGKYGAMGDWAHLEIN